jgi:hypothetical protein
MTTGNNSTVNHERTGTRRSSRVTAGKPDNKKASKDAERSDRPMHAKVQNYLDRFSQAMTRGDTETMLSLWAIPAFLVDKEDTRVISDSADVQRFFSAGPEMYQQRGIENTRAEIESIDVIDERLVMVHVRWPYLDKSGREIGEESSNYTLKADAAGEFKLCVCTMRGEKSKDRHGS